MATTKVEHYLHVKVNMRIVFMGTPSYATTILKALMDDAQMDVVLVVTQEDKLRRTKTAFNATSYQSVLTR